MPQPRFAAAPSVLIALSALAVVLSYQAGANRSAPPRPATVGTINLGRILEEVTERAEWDARLRSMEEQLGAEARGKQEAVNKKKERLEALSQGPEWGALREEMAMDILEADAWFKFERARLDRERSLMWQDLYKSVKTEADKLALAEGLDLVLVNDSLGEIRSTGDAQTSAEAVVLQQITARRLVFASKEVDITDRLIVRMNNARVSTPAGAGGANKPK